MSGCQTRHPFRAAILTLALLAAPFATRAQEAYPARNVRFIVPFTPGGPPDITARLFGSKLQEKWGQSVIVENRPGGAGNIGAIAAARAEPDGYTILVTSSALAVNLTLFEKPGYALSDFQTAAVPVVSPNLVIASPTLKQSTLADVVGAAKTENFAYSSPGIGTTSNLSGELIFRILNKLDVRHVPFGGGPPAVLAVLSGQVQIGVVALPSALEQVKAGALKALATTTARRLPELPDTPTVRETGAGDVEAVTSIGFYMPAKTPAVVLDKFNADINAIIASGALDKALAGAGFTSMRQNPSQAQAYVEGEMNKWASIIKATGLKAE
jgi:tripartite-type tricarboxylate transporter receptor subunit TctC